MRANIHTHPHTARKLKEKTVFRLFPKCWRHLNTKFQYHRRGSKSKNKRRQCKKRRKKAEKTGEQLTGDRKREGGVSGVGMGVAEVGRGELPTHNALVDVNTLLKQISCHLNDNFEKGQSANGHIERGQRYSGAVVQWDIG